MIVILGQSLLFLLGIGFLVGGAYVLVAGGTRMAVVLKVPAVVVGLTVVAFGTSAPELFVSLVGAFKGSTGLVLGNVIGSNVANLGLILGLSAILRPVIVEKGLTRREVPLMLGVSVVFAYLCWDGTISRRDALVLVFGFAIFMVWTLRSLERGQVIVPTLDKLPEIDPDHRLRELVKGSGQVLLGIVGLAAGGHFIVGSAIFLAQKMGVSETLIGLTIVAVGTSLPELATTVVASLRNQDDLALGNIVGSNLFNILAVAGPVGVLWDLNVEDNLEPVGSIPLQPTPIQAQLASMLLLTILVFVMIILGRNRIGRLRGFVLLATYGLIMLLWTSTK